MRLARFGAGASLSAVSTKTGLAPAFAGLPELPRRLAAFLAGAARARALPPAWPRGAPCRKSVLMSARKAESSDKMRSSFSLLPNFLAMAASRDFEGEKDDTAPYPRIPARRP